jgi:hypothetical protein
MLEHAGASGEFFVDLSVIAHWVEALLIVELARGVQSAREKTDQSQLVR